MRTKVIIVAVLSLFSSVPGMTQQREQANARILEAVALARVEHVNDSTAFERCHIEALIGREHRNLFREGDLLPRQVETGPVECGVADSRTPGARRNAVIADSISVGDSTAVAYLRVRRGEMVHNERHTLIPLRGSDRWLVQEITISKPGRYYFRDPR